MSLASQALRCVQALAAPGWRADAVSAFFRGALHCIAPRKGRIDSNLRLVYPEKDPAWRTCIRRKLYEHLAWTVTELMVLQRDTRQALDWIEEVQGLSFREEVFSRKGGALILSAHFGNWELLGSWCAQTFGLQKDHPFYVLVQDIHDPGVSSLIQEYRGRSGLATLPKDTPVPQLVRLLKEGARIAVLTDVSWVGGVRLPFMGQVCTNTVGPAILSILASVPILPLGIYRSAPFRHEVRFFPPLAASDGGDRRSRAEALTLRMNQVLETMIAPRPELWFWMHNRWKS